MEDPVAFPHIYGAVSSADDVELRVDGDILMGVAVTAGEGIDVHSNGDLTRMPGSFNFPVSIVLV